MQMTIEDRLILWCRDITVPFDPKTRQYACHIHGHDARTRIAIKTSLVLLVLSILLSGIGGWLGIGYTPELAAPLLVGFAIAMVHGMLGLSTDNACFPTCTCNDNQKEAQ